MSRKAVDITLTVSEREQLERWSRGHQTPRSLAERAQIILMASQGLRNDAIGEQWGTAGRASASGCDVLRKGVARDCPMRLVPGSRLSTGRRRNSLLAQLDSPPPRGYAAWNGRRLAQALGVPADWVWATLRRHRISLQRRRSWCISTDPEFARKAADIVGLSCIRPRTQWC